MNSPSDWVRKIGNWPSMNSKMMRVLEYLVAAKAQGSPYVPLEDVDSRTVKALFNRDWIFVGHDGELYNITERGERAFHVYQQPARRNDAICPTCGIRPRHVTASGRLSAYCLECDNESKRKAYKLKRPTKNPDSLCPQCHKRQRHIYKNGRVTTYCLSCKNARNRRRKKKDRKRDVKLAQKGIVKLCARPGCTRPRHVSPSGVLDWCREHYREWYNEYRHKKKAGQPRKPIGRPRKNVEASP